jgi:hypothetical protein
MMVTAFEHNTQQRQSGAKFSESSSRAPSTGNGDDVFQDEIDGDLSSKDSEPQDPETIEKVLAHAETRQIFWLRLTATGLGSSAVFFRTRKMPK